MDPGGVGGQLPIAGGARRAIHVLYEEAAAVLHRRACPCDPQVTDGHYLRKGTLQQTCLLGFPSEEKTRLLHGWYVCSLLFTALAFYDVATNTDLSLPGETRTYTEAIPQMMILNPENNSCWQILFSLFYKRQKEVQMW